MTERILLTGRHGQVGAELLQALRPLGELIATGRQEFDLARTDVMINLLDVIKPTVIVNAAAFTQVDRAEQNVAEAMQVNAQAPILIAQWATKNRVPLIHYSTNYVFDGTKSAAYIESDETNPLSNYGQSKWAGEYGIRQTGAAHLILRLGWVYGLAEKKFLKTVLRHVRAGAHFEMVDDQLGTPTWCRSVAQSTAQLIKKAVEKKASTHDTLADVFAAYGGTYHLSPQGNTTRHGWASEILRLAQQVDRSLRNIEIQKVKTVCGTGIAKRPYNGQLNSQKIETSWGLALPRWEHSLYECMQLMHTDKCI